MLFPEKMSEVSIIVHKSSFEPLLSALHESGLMQINDLMNSEQIKKHGMTKHEQPVKRAEVLSELILEASRLHEILRKTERKPKNIYRALMSFTPPRRTEIEGKPIFALISEARRTLWDKEFINELDSERAELETELSDLKLQVEKLELFKKMNFDLNLFTNSERIAIKTGRTTMPGELKKDLEDSLSLESKQFSQYGLYFHPLPPEQEGYIAVMIIPLKELANVRKVVVGRYFKELELAGFTGTPETVILSSRSRIKELEGKIDSITGKLAQAREAHFQELSVLLEELELTRKKTQVEARFGETPSAIIISGWCTSSNTKPLEKLCESASGGNVSVKFRELEREEKDDIPVQLNNPKWAKPFEMLTTTFAYPKYNEIDPTLVIAPLFILFFGLMLGDAGYGIIILILSIFAYVKFGKSSKALKNLSYLGIFAGTSTTVVGIFMGTFFGDLVQRFIYKDPEALLYSAEVMGFSLPYDAFRSPMPLFILALLIGMFILNLGFILGAMQNIRAGKPGKFATEQLSWFILQPPAILLIGDLMLGLWELPGNITMISYVVLAAGLILLLARYKGLTLFEITGYLGDWLSFVRLLALSLATVGMALTFNIMAELILNLGYNSATLVIFSIISIIVLLILHIFNLAIQSLGAAIHSLRLQYIELFNRCYSGGGVPFSPFYSNRIYSKLRSKK